MEMSVKSFQQIFLFLEIEHQRPVTESVETNSNVSEKHSGIWLAVFCDDNILVLEQNNSDRWYGFSVVHSHWSRFNEAQLSLVESFRVLLAPAVLCHKEPARRIQSPLLGDFCLLLAGSLCIRIVGFHVRKGPVIGALMP